MEWWQILGAGTMAGLGFRLGWETAGAVFRTLDEVIAYALKSEGQK